MNMSDILKSNYKVTFKHNGKEVYSAIAINVHRHQALDTVSDAYCSLIRQGMREPFTFDTYTVTSVGVA